MILVININFIIIKFFIINLLKLFQNSLASSTLHRQLLLFLKNLYVYFFQSFLIIFICNEPLDMIFKNI